MSKAYNESAGAAKGPAKSKVFSPSNNPAQAMANAGGMPPEKNVDQIFAANTPKSAPGSVKSSN